MKLGKRRKNEINWNIRRERGRLTDRQIDRRKDRRKNRQTGRDRVKTSLKIETRLNVNRATILGLSFAC